MNIQRMKGRFFLNLKNENLLVRLRGSIEVKKEIILFEHKNQTKRTKIVCQHQVDFHFQSVLGMYKTQKMIFRSLY